MDATLVLPAAMADDLRRMASVDVETAAVMLAQKGYENGETLRLLATHMVPVPEASYAVRAADRLSITSDGYVPALGQAADEGAIPIWVHSHPGTGGIPRPSNRDRV